MSRVTSTWSEIADQASAQWQGLRQASLATVKRIRRSPDTYAQQVEAFWAALEGAREDIVASSALVEKLPADDEDRQAAEATLKVLAERHTVLAAPYLADATGVQTGTAGVPLLAVGGLAVGAAGVAWAVAAYQYATNLREQTAVVRQELEARVAANAQGTTLQPSTLPSGVGAAGGKSSIGGLLAVGALLALAGGAVWLNQKAA